MFGWYRSWRGALVLVVLAVCAASWNLPHAIVIPAVVIILSAVIASLEIVVRCIEVEHAKADARNTETRRELLVLAKRFEVAEDRVLLLWLAHQDLNAAENVISEKLEFIWVCVPKAASRSILNVLTDNAEHDFETTVIEEPIEKILRANSDYRTYFKFAFVRNPFSRVVSFYRDKICNPSDELGIFDRYRRLRRRMPFEEFIDWLCSKEGSDDFADRHWLSQHSFLATDGGELLVDFVGKIENLQEDFDHVCRRIGLPPMTLPWLNMSGVDMAVDGVASEQPVREYYDDATRSRIRRRYAEDFRLFNYPSS